MQIRIGTRASKLALIQTNWVLQQLHRQWPNLELQIEQIRTTGDQITHLSLSQIIGGDGVFVTEIERALVEKRIDLAVHSLKDLPTAQPEGLQVVVVGPREDVRDVLLISISIPRMDVAPHHLLGGEVYTLAPHGSSGNAAWAGDLLLKRRSEENLRPMRIGTCSLRRTAQIRGLSQNVEILPLRGNVDTRLRKLEGGDYDAIVLAAAGLHRLYTRAELEQRCGHVYYLPVEVMMPAPGQGALALECRAEPEILALLAPLQDRALQAATTAERRFMRHLGAGCYLPVAAYGLVEQGNLMLQGLVISLDGRRQIRVEHSIPWRGTSTLVEAEHLGAYLAEQAVMQGADEIMRELALRRE